MPPIRVSCCAWLLWLGSATLAVADVQDLRAERWKRTTVVNVGTSAVQHTGDDTRLGPFPDLIERHLRSASAIDPSARLAVKTVAVSLTLPQTSVDEQAVATAQRAVPSHALLAPIAGILLSRFSKDKSASAVFCVAINGQNYLGSDARLFRSGAEKALEESVQAGLEALVQAIRKQQVSASPACDAGWEGGQATPE